MISKKTFCDTLEALKKYYDIQNEMSKLLRSNDIEGCGFIPFSSEYETIIIDLLEESVNDKTHMISYWAFDCDYGGEIEEDSVTDAEGNNIDISTPEKLYDYLIKEYDK